MSIPVINNSTTATDSRSSVRSAPGQAASTAGGSRAGQTQNAQTGASQTGVDAVSISTQAGDLQALEASIRELPEVDSVRVNTLREQIDAGQYTVDSQRLADKILAFENKL